MSPSDLQGLATRWLANLPGRDSHPLDYMTLPGRTSTVSPELPPMASAHPATHPGHCSYIGDKLPGHHLLRPQGSQILPFPDLLQEVKLGDNPYHLSLIIGDRQAAVEP